MHWIKAKRAFLIDQSRVQFFRLTHRYFGRGSDPAWVALTSLLGGDPERWDVSDGARLRAVLSRTDLTLHEGKPFAALNAAYGTMAIAVGPDVPPRQLSISGVFHMRDAVLERLSEGQPEWWLFDVTGPRRVPKMGIVMSAVTAWVPVPPVKKRFTATTRLPKPRQPGEVRHYPTTAAPAQPAPEPHST